MIDFISARLWEKKKQTSNPLCLSRHCFAKGSDSAFLCYFLSFPVMVCVFQRVELTPHIGRKMHIIYQLDTLSASVGGKAGGKRPWHRLITWDFFKLCGDAVAVNAMHDWYIEKNALTANSSSNSLLTSLPLIKCFLLHPTFLGVWKSRHQSMTGSFPARLLLSGEEPWERGCILAETRWHLCMRICRRFTRVVWRRICYAFVACSFACVAKISSCIIKLSTAFDTCRWVSLDQFLY